MRLRILPVLILMATAMLGLRLGDIWQGFGSIAVAQDEESGPGKPVEDPFKDVQLAQAQGAGQNAGDGRQAGGADGPNARKGQQTAAKSDKAGDQGGVTDPLSMSDAEIEVLQQLSKRRKELDKRAAALDEREQLLEAAKKRLQKDIARLEKLKKKIQGLLIDYDNQQDKQVKRLVNIYSNMDADAAARIFEDLEMNVLLKVVDRMNERATAPILAEMKSEKAQQLTLELAKRKDLPVPEVKN
jgi:flagellar motility protein MotE (MotC chaperone)